MNRKFHGIIIGDIAIKPIVNTEIKCISIDKTNILILI